MANRIRLYPWELDSMPDYSCSIPTATTLWKMWRRNTATATPPNWIVGQYVPCDVPDQVGIRWYEVQVLSGPVPKVYRAPDWHNYSGWKREMAASRGQAAMAPSGS